MAILTMFEVHGDPDEILAGQEEKISPTARPLFAENGGISQTVVRTDDGIMMVNVWENEDGMRKVAEQVRPLADDLGFEQVGWRQYEVLRHRTPED
jgi:hypothetical protein